MWVVKAIDTDTNICLEESYAWREVEIDSLKYSYHVTKPKANVVVEEYKPWTKEMAEAEIRQKAKDLGLPDPFEAPKKKKTSKK